MSYPPQGLDKVDVLANQATLLSRVTEVRAEYIDGIFDTLRHSTYVYPDNTNLTCTLTAGQAAHAWSSWAEIVDSGANKLSTLFASSPGHLSVIQQEELSDINALYMLEVAYGDAKVHITSQRFAGSGKFQNPRNIARTLSEEIIAGEAIYYRMKSDTAVADTAKIHIRYHIH